MAKQREAQKIWRRRDRAANPEKYREEAREKYRKHRDKILEQVKASYYRRHERELEADRMSRKKMDPLKRKARTLKRDYGMTLENFQDLVIQQEGRCAICLEERPLCVDHCHTEGHVRGLLCSQCNVALGFFKDDPVVMQRAIDYLRTKK